MILSERVIDYIRKTLTCPVTMETSGLFGPVKSFYTWCNPDAQVFYNDTIGIKLDSKRSQHPLYHNIMGCSNTRYSFLSNRADVIMSCFDPHDINKKIDLRHRVLVYLEETDCIANCGNVNRRSELISWCQNPNLLAIGSHLSDTVRCLSQFLETDKIRYIPLPSCEFDFGDSFFDRSLNEENVYVLFSGSFGDGQEVQSRNRGAHITDAVMCEAQLRCPHLKLVVLNSDYRFACDHITFNGNIDDYLCYHIYAACDVHAMLSPRVHAHTMLTAISTGQACFGTDTFGFNDFIDDNGYRFPHLLECTVIDEEYGGVTNLDNYSTFRDRVEGLDGYKDYIDGIATVLYELYHDRNRLMQLRKKSYTKSISEFSRERHIETMVNIIC